MADKSKIEWTDATANVINGCSLASPGCTNCYAMRMAGSRLKKHPTRAGLTQPSKAGPVWTGEVRFHEPALQQVLAWKAPRMIFWNAHGDMFHDNVPDEWIDRCFAVMALTPHHTHQVLTKRSDRMQRYFTNMPDGMGRIHHVAIAAMKILFHDGREGGWSSLDPDYQAAYQRINSALGMVGDWTIATANWPLPNVWLGVSVEDQQRANQRIPDLLGTPAAVRWISAEPLLGPVDLTQIRGKFWTFSAVDDRVWTNNENGLPHYDAANGYPQIDWVVAGGESGPRARPVHIDWVRTLWQQCYAAGVAFNLKQWGEWFPYGQKDADGVTNVRTMAEQHGKWHEWPNGGGFSVRLGKKQAGRLLDGVELNQFPEVR